MRSSPHPRRLPPKRNAPRWVAAASRRSRSGRRTISGRSTPAAMMNTEQYVVDHHLATVISQSFASAEDAFASPQSLQNLRHAFIAAAQNGVTVLGSSGDNGTANNKKEPTKNPQLIPYPTVEWP